MPTYVFAYRSKKGYTGSPDAMAEWGAWFQELGGAVTNMGNPVFDRKTVGNTGSDTVLGGYSLIKADDLETAVTLAKGSPVLRNGGGVEVGELTEM
jgi:hypothetical protein